MMNSNFTIISETDGEYIVLPGQSPEGDYILSILVKRTYDIDHRGKCVRAELDRKLVSGDTHYDDPMNSSVEFESDFIPYKNATDVVLNGRAYAPEGKAVQKLDAFLSVGDFRKDICIFGDRYCRIEKDQAPIFTDPVLFITMDLRYEKAYGGVDIYSDPKLPYAYPRNHLGCGFIVKKIGLKNLLLPNIEYPSDLITPERLLLGEYKNWEQQPLPAGFGWTLKSWQPRASLAGVLPADRQFEKELRELYSKAIPPSQRSQYEQTKLPEMDFSFFNGAPNGMALPFLSGSETIETMHLCRDGDKSIQLPDDTFGLGLDIGNGVEAPQVVLSTIMIRMEENQVDLVWRGAVKYPGPDWLVEMKKMEIFIQ